MDKAKVRYLFRPNPPKAINFKLECHRFFGEPKLKKPKVCNNKNLLGSVYFRLNKPVACKVWVDAEAQRVLVLHRDFDSELVSPEEAKIKGIVFKPKKQKFIYADEFYLIVLRNEAVISFDFPDFERHILYNRMRLTEAFFEQLTTNDPEASLYFRYEDFFEEILKLLEENIDETTDP